MSNHREEQIQRARQLKTARYSNAEIAEALGLDESTVRVIIQPRMEVAASLVRVTLTAQQYETALIALGMLDAGDEDSAKENEAALKAFADTKEELGVETSDGLQRHIPMMLAMGDQETIGFGAFEDGLLKITVSSQLLVAKIENLAEAEHIRELYLGMGWPVMPEGEKR